MERCVSGQGLLVAIWMQNLRGNITDLPDAGLSHASAARAFQSHSEAHVLRHNWHFLVVDAAPRKSLLTMTSPRPAIFLPAPAQGGPRLGRPPSAFADEIYLSPRGAEPKRRRGLERDGRDTRGLAWLVSAIIRRLTSDATTVTTEMPWRAILLVPLGVIRSPEGGDEFGGRWRCACVASWGGAGHVGRNASTCPDVAAPHPRSASSVRSEARLGPDPGARRRASARRPGACAAPGGRAM